MLMNLFLKNQLKIHKFFENLVILVPLFLITGPFLSDLSISLLSIYYFFIRKKNHDNERIIKIFFVIIFFFYILILISSVLAEDKILSIKNSLFYLRFILFSICFFYLLKNNEKILLKLFFVLILCFIILIFDGLFQSYFKINIIGLQINEEYFGSRVSSFFGDELILGSYLTRFSPIIIGLGYFFFKDKKGFNIFLILFIFFMEIIVFLSGERTAFVLFNMILFLLLLLLNDSKKLSVLIFLVVSIIITGLIVHDGPSKKRIINETIKDLKPKSYNSQLVIINRQYHEHFLSAFQMFKDNILFGVGPKNFRVVCKQQKYNYSEYTCSTHPHNTYIQLLSETGIFSFLIIFCLFLIVSFLLLKQLYFKTFKKTSFLNNLEICILIHIFVSLFPLTPTGSFFNNWTSIMYYYPVAIIFWSFQKKKIL